MWKPPPSAGTPSTPGPSVRPSAWSRNASSTAAMQSRKVRSSRTSWRDRMRMLGPPGGRGIESLEERHPLSEHLLIVGGGGEQRTDGDVDAPRLLVRIFAVPQVGLVDHLGQPDEATVAQAGPLQERFERAVLALVTELYAGCVEGDRVLRELGRGREDEFRVGVDEALDQPRRGDAVDVGARPCDPPPSAQSGQVEGRALFAMDGFRTSSSHGDDLLETPYLGATGGVEVIDVPDALVLPGEARELLLHARALHRRLFVEALQNLPIVGGELAVIVIARLVEHPPHVFGADVLDLIDSDERRFPAL